MDYIFSRDNKHVKDHNSPLINQANHVKTDWSSWILSRKWSCADLVPAQKTIGAQPYDQWNTFKFSKAYMYLGIVSETRANRQLLKLVREYCYFSALLFLLCIFPVELAVQRWFYSWQTNLATVAQFRRYITMWNEV